LGVVALALAGLGAFAVLRRRRDLRLLLVRTMARRQVASPQARAFETQRREGVLVP
jgi:hypothetical protein